MLFRLKHLSSNLHGCLGVFLLISTAYAQSAPKLNSLPHEFYQRGTSQELSLSGENLGDAKEVLINGAPGVTASIIPTSTPGIAVESSLGGVSTVVKTEAKKIAITLSISNNAALTDRELRLVTKEGVSNPVSFRVSELPEVVSAQNNNSLESAQQVELPATINGSIANAAESDFFRMKAKKGEHLILDVNAYRSGSALDSSLAVLDKTGKELARNEDAAGLDSILEFKVPEEGEYIVELRDFRYQGGGNYKYRLRAGVLPFVANSFPFGGKRGDTVEVELKGANLEGADKISLNLAADAGRGIQEIRASTSRGLSNPFIFDVSDLPQFMEKEPNSAIDQADPISIPVVINGRIGGEKDYDAFKFHANKEQRIIFDVFAFRFGSKLDALLTLTDDRGNILQRNDDALGEDPRLEHRFSEEGDYVILIEDLLGRGGETFGYRMTVTVPQPNFSVVFLPDTPRIHRGGRVPIRCEVNRMNDFNEPVKITCEKLPPGIYAEPLLIPRGVSSGLLVLSATANAPIGSVPLKLVANAEVNAAPARKTAQPVAGDKPAKAGFLTVLESAPFEIESATLMADFEQNRSGNIEVVVERKNGFSRDIKITAEGFSTGRDAISRSFDSQPLLLKAGENHGTLSLKTKLDSEIAVRHIVLRGETEQNGNSVATYSGLLPIATSPIPFVLSTTLKKLIVTALPSSSTSAAAEGVFMVNADRRDGFEGEIDLHMEGVPEGVTLALDKIPAKTGEIQVKLVASEKAPTGKDFQLKITGTGIHKDHIYKFEPAPVTLTINAPEGTEAKEPKLATAQK